MRNKILLVLILFFFIVPQGTAITTINNSSTNGWTSSNIGLVNSTKDSSSSNVTGGILYYSWNDGVVGGTSSTGSMVASNGYLNLTASNSHWYYNHTTLPKDNFNLTIDLRTVVNGSEVYHTAWVHPLWWSITPRNEDLFYLRSTNISNLELRYVGISNVNVSTQSSNLYNWNTLAYYTSGDLSLAYINNTLFNSHNHANRSLLKTIMNWGSMRLSSSTASTVVANFDNLRIFINNTGYIYIYNQSAQQNYIINRTKLITYDTDSNLSIDVYIRKNGSSSWFLAQSDVINNTWFNSPIFDDRVDYQIVLNGNSTHSPLFSELSYDKTDAVCLDSNATQIITSAVTCSDLNMTKRGPFYVSSTGSLFLSNVTMIMYSSFQTNASSGLGIESSTFKIGKDINGIVQTATIKSTSSNNYILNSTISTINESDGTNECEISGASNRPVFKFYNQRNFLIQNSTFTCLDIGLFFQNNDDTFQNTTIETIRIMDNNRGLVAQGSNGYVFNNSTISDSEADGIQIGTNIANDFNWSITNITISDRVDRGVLLYSGTHDITINNIIVENASAWSDGEMAGIQLWNGVYNVNISNSNLTFGTMGISLINNVSNINITNVSFHTIPVFDKEGLGTTTHHSFNEPVTAIGITEAYGGYVLDGTEEFLINRSHYSLLSSDSIIISQNTYDSDILVLLHTQGVTNLTHDLTSSQYWLWSTYLPRLFDQDDLYFSRNSTLPYYGIQWHFNRTNEHATRRTNTTTLQYYNAFPEDVTRPDFTSAGQEVLYNYVVNGIYNISIYPMGWVWNATTANRTNISTYNSSKTEYPFSFYLYSPSFTPFFGSSKNNTMFNNGTTYIQMLNDTLEPVGYRIINATIIPSTTVYVTVNTYNSTLFNFTTSGSGTMNITVNNSDFNVTNSISYHIKKDGVIQQASIASGNSVSFTNIVVGSDYVVEEGLGTVSITIPANSWGMFNNWSSNLTFSQIIANESNDVAYTWYNTTSGDWEDLYVGQTYNQNNVIPYWNSVLGYFNAQTTITATVVTPVDTGLTAGWNMLYVEGGTNRTLSEIQTNVALSCTVNDLYKWNTTTGDYDNAGTSIVQPNEGFIVDVAGNCNWVRTTI